MALDRTEIADQLREAITSGDYSPGDKLRPQRELAKQLGAAPNTVGAALKILAGEGLVTLREKAAAVVRDPAEASAAAPIEAELAEVRTELQDLRGRLSEVDQRVADLINRVATDQPPT
ncbi:winged helix-turn-helix domain-containing protein [Saccharopolyspora endophytica]|uniref:Winged helix-turn-helix transcriptional regulator n=1 Tax=Saccharopolyspora endophytica TaxID=543886 RepID=A0ABS5DEB0_9PSEU|nr:winged helix-turn-helix domain-containing protein [Saccharopolyspora endophytica]MBQ0924617.1 winged helix-turn-helix transcriptional regulator [Saccharopolyspora endophytica]